MAGRLIIPSTRQLPAEIASRFGEKTGRQRLMEHDGHLLLVLHKVPDTFWSCVCHMCVEIRAKRFRTGVRAMDPHHATPSLSQTKH